MSGGLDSAVLLAEIAARHPVVHPLYIQNGLFWEASELYWLRRFLQAVARPSMQPLQILSLPMGDVYGAHWSITGRGIPGAASDWSEVYLPGRNLILLSKAAVFCALNHIAAIALGPLKTNQFGDSSREFFSYLERGIALGLDHRLEVLTPFAELSKDEVIRRGSALPLELTFSCLNPRNGLHCGCCNKCAERMAAFVSAGLPDQTAYATAPGVASGSPADVTAAFPTPPAG